MQELGYEGLDTSQNRYNIGSVVYDADSDMHVLLADGHYMYDNETLRTSPALAAKSLKAAGSESTRTLFAEMNTVRRRDLNYLQTYLKNLGVESKVAEVADDSKEIVGVATAAPEEGNNLARTQGR